MVFLYICVMKYIVLIITLFITSVSFSQNNDSIMFDYINKYRVKNGKKSLVWSPKSQEVSISQAEIMIKNDSMYHSHNNNTHSNFWVENCMYHPRAGYIGVKEIGDFKKFIVKNFGVTYDDILKDVNLYFITYIIYNWSNDAPHNMALLTGDINYGSVHIIIKNVVKKPNKISGREIFPGLGPFYYKGLVSSTYNGHK